MKIVDIKNSVNEIVGLILSKARYQKVVFCLDENSDMQMVDDVCEAIGRGAVIIKYYYNKKNVVDFFNMINNGVRVVIYDVSIEHFYNTQNNNTFLLNIFVCQSEFTLPYISNVKSLYGENILLCNTNVRDYRSVIFMYELALNAVWSKLLNGANVDTGIFKRIDALMNCENFYTELMAVFECLQFNLNNAYRGIDEKEIEMYTHLKVNCILQMLTMVNEGEEKYIDFYKCMKSTSDVDKAYKLLVKYDIIERLRIYCINLIKLASNINNRIKIIIKKYLNNNINYKKCNKIIKNEAMRLNIDNLLYISYILNCV